MKRAARRTTKARGNIKPRARAFIGIKRVYDPSEPSDGMRILIDRLWPRGLAKDKLALDRWAKELAPSNELRRWYGHDRARFAEFRRRYLAELGAVRGELAELRAAMRGRTATLLTATLLTATRELDLSHATVLRDVLLAKRVGRISEA
ncbi:MAG: DUF488 domain-containing protein [Xanthobacteraceae bacterium]